MDFEAVVGLEVHVQLKTATKIFCRCKHEFGGEPNSQVCPVCLGYPGTLPVLNRQAVQLAVRLALALGCRVRPRSVFARKNYFYPDLPKGYQISQFEEPLADGGSLPLYGGGRRIALRRLHLEEDAGKLLHQTPGGGSLPGKSLIDFNRCGVPLVEIVSEPDLGSPSEAHDFLQSLHQLLRYTETSDANMEEGSLRCDANVSLRRRGETALGTKVEVKNLNSFRNVARALEHEIERQTALLEAGDEVSQETRGFDAATALTRSLRGKEEAHDYRYCPDPDLPPVIVSAERQRELREALPELPWERRQRFAESFGLSAGDALVLSSSRELADYFEAALSGSSATAKGVANWTMSDLLRELKARDVALDAAPAPARLARLVAMVEDGAVSSTAARDVFGEMWSGDEEPALVIERLNLGQVQDRSTLDAWVDEVLALHPGPVAQLRAGEDKVLGFLVGLVMKRSEGRADPVAVRRLLRRAVVGTAASDPGT